VVESGASEAWSSLLSTQLPSGARVLTSRYGRDASRLAAEAEGAGLDVVSCDVEPGEGAPVEWFCHLLWWDPSIAAILVAQEESSTGVRTDIGAVRRAIDRSGSDALLLVDTTPLGVRSFEQTRWRVDAAVCGPWGTTAQQLSVVSVGATMVDTHKVSAAAGVTWRPGHRLASLAGSEYWAPADAESMARRVRHARELRRCAATLGIEPRSAERWASDSCTVWALPSHVDPDVVSRQVADLGGEAWHVQGSEDGNSLRFDHLHLACESDCLAALATLEAALGPTSRRVPTSRPLAGPAWTYLVESFGSRSLVDP
jgi:aspartate aminotransferase-like enzyme